jgi:hypothetical protein
MAKRGTNTAPKLLPTKKKVPGRPFYPGDPRINRKGRPHTFDTLRALAQQIAVEMGASGSSMSNVEAIMRDWAFSTDVRKQQAFIEYAYGKVPTSNVDAQVDVNHLTDEQLRRLSNGESIIDILTSKS